MLFYPMQPIAQLKKKLFNRNLPAMSLTYMRLIPVVALAAASVTAMSATDWTKPHTVPGHPGVYVKLFHNIPVAEIGGPIRKGDAFSLCDKSGVHKKRGPIGYAIEIDLIHNKVIVLKFARGGIVVRRKWTESERRAAIQVRH